MSERNKVRLLEPELYGRIVILFAQVCEEGRIRDFVTGTAEVRAEEDEDMKYRLQIMDDTMSDTKQKQLNCNERWSAL